MSWEFSAAARRTMERWSAVCVEQTGLPSEYLVEGKRYSWAWNTQSHGAVDGVTYRILPGGRRQRSGRFRISADGAVLLGPAMLKECSP